MKNTPQIFLSLEKTHDTAHLCFKELAANARDAPRGVRKRQLEDQLRLPLPERDRAAGADRGPARFVRELDLEGRVVREAFRLLEGRDALGEDGDLLGVRELDVAELVCELLLRLARRGRTRP